MQLSACKGFHAEKRKDEAERRNIASLVGVATCSLLAASGMDAAAGSGQGKSTEWTSHAAVLSYSENGRITVNQGLLKLKGEHERGSLQLKLGYDVVSGPSENGAVPSPEAQTFTTPSGNADYLVEPDEMPWYDIERHPRKEISISKTDILSADYSVSYGARYSTEATYESKSINGGIAYNANNKNTQYSLALSYEDAQVEPYGGVVEPHSPVLNRSQFGSEGAFVEAWEAQRLGKSRGKEVLGLVAGVTQVINRKTLMQFNYSYTTSDGYLNDAQKVVSVIDEAGLPLYNVHENRPGERTRQSLFWQGKFSTGRQTVLDVQYRYYWDDWKVDSHTVSMGYQVEITDTFKIEPQARLYDQSEAEFFRHAVFAGTDGSADLPDTLSADYRLAATRNYTVGLNLNYYRANDDVISLRIAWYDINPREDSTYKRGYLDTVDVLPDIDAVIVGLSYEF